jgi:hypothetical protein
MSFGLIKMIDLQKYPFTLKDKPVLPKKSWANGPPKDKKIIVIY